MFDRFRRRNRPNPAIQVEDMVTLDGCTILPPAQIGYRSYANDSLLRNITIGRFCSIGRRCSLGAALHDVECFTTHSAAASPEFRRDPVTIIGNDVWIGDNVVIIAGLTIGDGAVIGAGAVVTRDVEPYAIVVGVPAQLLRYRFDEATRTKLLATSWWQYGESALAAIDPGAGPDALLLAIARNSLSIQQPAFWPR